MTSVIAEDGIPADDKWHSFGQVGFILALAPGMDQDTVRLWFLSEKSYPERYFRLFRKGDEPEGIYQGTSISPDGCTVFHLFEALSRPVEVA